MVIDKGNCICEKCGKEFYWILSDYSIESLHISGCIDNGIKFIAAKKCPHCECVQSNSLIYDSRRVLE